MREVEDRPTANASERRVMLPKFLLAEFDRIKPEFPGISLSGIAARALFFGMFGPHPYTNPVDGLNDALKNYSKKTGISDDVAKELVRSIAESLGVKIEISE